MVKSACDAAKGPKSFGPDNTDDGDVIRPCDGEDAVVPWMGGRGACPTGTGSVQLRTDMLNGFTLLLNGNGNWAFGAYHSFSKGFG